MSFGDLELHGYSGIFFVGVNQSGPGTSSTSNHIIYTALGDDFMVHYVNMEGHGAPRVVGMEPR